MNDPDAEQINALHAECFSTMRNTVEKAIAIGELLSAKKAKCDHGNWLPWVEENLEFNRGTAAQYIRCFDRRAELLNVRSGTHLTIKEFASGKANTAKTNGANVVKRRHADPPKEHYKQPEIAVLFDEGLSDSEIGDKLGLKTTIVADIVKHEKIKRAAQANITPDMLSMTAQDKLRLAIKQHTQKLSAEWQVAVNARVDELLADTIGPRLRKEQEEAKRIVASRKGIMDRKAYGQILACLHPDRVEPELKERYADAFRIFTRMEKLLLNENESPTEYTGIPKTSDEWAELKRKATEARRNKRTTFGGGIQSPYRSL